MAKSKYTPGDVVYLASDPDQIPRMILERIPAKYAVRIGNEIVEVYDVEISDEPNELTKILHGGSKED